MRWRLRADGTSITQYASHLPVLRDYLAALGGGIHVLCDAGAHEAVTARIELVLAMDVPPLEQIARAHPDPEYAARLNGFLDHLRTLPEYDAAHPDPTLAAALSW